MKRPRKKRARGAGGCKRDKTRRTKGKWIKDKHIMLAKERKGFTCSPKTDRSGKTGVARLELLNREKRLATSEKGGFKAEGS